MSDHPPAFYNTNELSGRPRFAAERRALTQEERVLLHFQHNPGLPLTPDQVLQIMPAGIPLTSVRRAITNLTLRGLLVKTDKMREGTYGAPVHCWQIARRDPAQLELV